MHSNDQLHTDIPKLDVQTGKEVAAYIDTLTKPTGSLGRLEEIAIKLAEITGERFPEVSPPAAILFAADHGITEEGVSAYPKEVTVQMVQNFLQGGAAMNAFCEQIGALFTIVDVGVAGSIEHPNLVAKKVRQGTRNFFVENALTNDEVMQALQVGQEQVQTALNNHAKSLILGEMGIGNTTTASAIIGVITGGELKQLIGPGTGLDDAGVAHKYRIIKQALAARKPNRHEPFDIMEKIGGLEIAAMAGAMLEAAKERLPIIVDGLICTAAALIAKEMNPRVVDYMFVGHQSFEPGHAKALQILGEEPLLDLHMRLGEGTGAAVAFPILLSAVGMLRHMATFDEAGVSEKQ